MRFPAWWANEPLMRITEIAAGGRPLDKAKIVSRATDSQAKAGAITGAT